LTRTISGSRYAIVAPRRAGCGPGPERGQHGAHGVCDRLECLVAGQLAGSGRFVGVDRVGDCVERRGQLIDRVG
jgi:hypothetical protein